MAITDTELNVMAALAMTGLELMVDHVYGRGEALEKDLAISTP